MPTDQNAPESTLAGYYEFGPYRLEVASRTLFRAGAFVPLTPKVAETLLLLVEAAGLIVTKEQLLERVWPGVVVEEGGIANNVSALRKLLKADFGEDGGIATVSRQGYRFTGEVRRGDGSRPAPSPAAAAPGAAQPAVDGSQGRSSVLVGDIENRTGDPIFDGTIRQALALVLAQSSYLEVLADRRVHAALAVMQRQGAPVLGDVALEVCQRTSTKAAITGSIFALGDDYVIGLYAIHGETGDTLLTEQARAHGKGEVLRALDQAALGLRTKLGESLASVTRFSSGLAEVATASLEALKAYSTGRQTWLSSGEAAAAPFLLRAIELDPNFLAALTGLALIYGNFGQYQRAAEYMQMAYDLRERASSDSERYRIIGVYHDIVTGDIHKALDAYRACLRFNPRDPSALNNCANACMILGQYEKAEPDLRTAVEIERSGVMIGNLTVTLAALGRVDEAQALIDEAFALKYDSYAHHNNAYHLAFLRGDDAAMKRHFDAVMGRENEEEFLVQSASNTEAFQGRFERARELSARAAELAVRGGSHEVAGTWRAESALRDAYAGFVDHARAQARAALATSTGRNVVSLAALALALSGEEAEAERLATQIDHDYPQYTLVRRYWLPSIRAALALGRRDWRRAVDVLEAATPLELGMEEPFIPALMIPPYLRGLAYLEGERWADAAAEFDKIVLRPHLVRNNVVFPLARAAVAKARAKA
jgi:DNA-binding winged helix-turn-helix (wHTH) protein/tetratricopeptide (TPR) repeat protein